MTTEVTIMAIGILLAALLPLLLGLIWARWRDPRRQERRRALRAGRVDTRWQTWRWPE